MNEIPKELQNLHEALKASKAAKYFVKIHWPEFSYRLSLKSPQATDSNRLLINIEVDKQHPGRFTYSALTNKPFNDEQAYYELEKNDNATTEAIIEMVYRLLEPELRNDWTSKY
ncbi:MAG: hypothetical protein AAGL17_25715 [Cyanobacteria bacterium J06576_12]